jgi:hypothetical protein
MLKANYKDSYHRFFLGGKNNIEYNFLLLTIKIALLLEAIPHHYK